MIEPRKPRPGDVLRVLVEGYDARGRAVGEAHDEHGRSWRASLRGAVPGDRVRASVLRRRGSRLELRLVEHERRGPRAVAPRCLHFGVCGGCSFQDLDYPAQLEVKQSALRATLDAAGLLAGLELRPIVGAPSPWHYRNKMEFSFGSRRWIAPGEPQGAARDFALGLHVPGRFDKVLDLAECHIVFEEAPAIVAGARELARALELAPWDVRTHRGLLRHLVLRKGFRTGEILANLLTASESPELVHPYAAALAQRHPEITTLVQSVNTRPADIAVGEWERVLHGPGAIRERLCGLELEISARSFFQTNTLQAEALLEAVREEAELGGRELVYDLYCGTGSIGLALARSARALVGFEEVRSAVEDARRNALRNAIDNARFVLGDVLDSLAAPELPRPDLCVVDPPRAGLHPRVLARLAALGARRLVWVSCNLASAAPQVAELVRAGHRLVRARPFDLFPHTPHVECVLTLERGAPPPA